MALFRWDDKLITNHSAIDADHKKLVDLINQLSDAMQAGKGKDVCGKVLDELINYTKTHFAMEERLMTAHAYPDATAHRAEHTRLVKEVLDFKAKFDAGTITLSAQLLGFLRDWLVNHIMQVDKVLAASLAGK